MWAPSEDEDGVCDKWQQAWGVLKWGYESEEAYISFFCIAQLRIHWVAVHIRHIYHLGVAVGVGVKAQRGANARGVQGGSRGGVHRGVQVQGGRTVGGKSPGIRRSTLSGGHSLRPRSSGTS